MLNVANPAAPGPLAVLPLPGGAAPDADAGPAFAQALDRASAAATAVDATAVDPLRAIDPTAVQPSAAEARPAASARGSSRKPDLAETLAQATIDTPAGSAAPKPDEASPTTEAPPVESAAVTDDAQAADLIAWVANLPLPPPAAAAAAMPTNPTAAKAVGAAAVAAAATPVATSAAAAAAAAAATTPTRPAPVEAATARDSAPPAPAVLAMPQGAAGRRADTRDIPDPRGAAPGVAETLAPRGDAARAPQWLAAQRETVNTDARITADNTTALPALPGGVAHPSPRPADAGTPLQAELHAELGSKDFAPALGSQLKVLVRDGVEHAQLRLNPAEMGPIEVRIRIDGSQAQVEFSAAQAPTRQALQEAVPALASALRDAGLTLSGGGVFEQARDPRGDAQPQARHGAVPSGENSIDEGAPLTPAPRMPRARGAVDLYA